ncbi:MAG: hypothetical protein RL386_600, partial [Bacteroidota bacterium]
KRGAYQENILPLQAAKDFLHNPIRKKIIIAQIWELFLIFIFIPP